MRNYFVCVYAISRNEEKFADRWMDAMGEADRVVVLDTGSEDGTVERLRARGAEVHQEVISPWRFDAARNRSLELVPEEADICVCTDLDEVFRPGWREALERAWQPGTGQARYRYTWSFNPDGSEGVVFWIEKIHARHGYRWVHPVHEVLRWTGTGEPGPAVWAEGIQLDHHPDPEKSRGSTCPCWSWRWRRSPMTTGTSTTWAGSTSFTAGGRTASAPWSGTSPCPPPSGGMSGRPPWGISPRPGIGWAGGPRPGLAPACRRRGSPPPGALAGRRPPPLPGGGLGGGPLLYGPGPGHHPAAPDLYLPGGGLGKSAP